MHAFEASLSRINPHLLGIFMKETVRRMMLEARRQRNSFKARVKSVDYKKEADVVTSGDEDAQELALRAITECYPFAGIVAEEKGMKRPCGDSSGDDYYFTVDPVDGTKAYVRKQSHAVTSMLSFVWNGEVVGATIGDVNTLEVYHTRPGSNRVHRIYPDIPHQTLAIDRRLRLADQYLLLREPLASHGDLAQAIAVSAKDGGCVHGHEISGGSIGAMFARLWKGEVGMILLPPCTSTAWDWCPVFCITKKMGFKCFTIEGERFVEYAYVPAERTNVPHELLFVHESRVRELRRFAAMWRRSRR